MAVVPTEFSKSLKVRLDRFARQQVESIRSHTVRVVLRDRYPSLKQAQDDLVEAINGGAEFSLVRPGKFENQVLIEFFERRCNPDPRKWHGYRRETLFRAANNAGVLAKTSRQIDNFAFSHLNAIRGADAMVTFPWTEWLAATPAVRHLRPIEHEAFNPINAVLADIEPWTKSLKGKKVAVVSSFSDSIARQVRRLHSVSLANVLFENCEIIPIPSPVTFAGAQSESSWEIGFQRLTERVSSVDYDVLLASAGAYGPLITDFAKTSSRVGIHVGGVLQLFFGISGRRWGPLVQGISNHLGGLQNWVAPQRTERPPKFRSVESGAYW